MSNATTNDTEGRRGLRVAQRSKETRLSVKYGESIARGVITVGGLLVIVAVLGIMVFLFRVVAPMLACRTGFRDDDHRPAQLARGTGPNR
jgi:ABC-type uncharacterized transport system permease subunit